MTTVLMVPSRQSEVESWGRRRRALRPASKRWDSTSPVAPDPPIATSTPSWWKVFASGMGTPGVGTLGRPVVPEPRSRLYARARLGP